MNQMISKLNMEITRVSVIINIIEKYILSMFWLGLLDCKNKDSQSSVKINIIETHNVLMLGLLAERWKEV